MCVNMCLSVCVNTCMYKSKTLKRWAWRLGWAGEARCDWPCQRAGPARLAWAGPGRLGRPAMARPNTIYYNICSICPVKVASTIFADIR